MVRAYVARIEHFIYQIKIFCQPYIATQIAKYISFAKI